jgi:hypothetical protein
MNEALIGEVVTLSAPSTDRLAGLIAATASAMLEAGGREPRDGDDLLTQIETALGAEDGTGGVTARLTLQIDGLVIRLHRGDDVEPHATVHCGA